MNYLVLSINLEMVNHIHNGKDLTMAKPSSCALNLSGWLRLTSFQLVIKSYLTKKGNFKKIFKEMIKQEPPKALTHAISHDSQRCLFDFCLCIM